jgi:hypothetical protein
MKAKEKHRQKLEARKN